MYLLNCLISHSMPWECVAFWGKIGVKFVIRSIWSSLIFSGGPFWCSGCQWNHSSRSTISCRWHISSAAHIYDYFIYPHSWHNICCKGKRLWCMLSMHTHHNILDKVGRIQAVALVPFAASPVWCRPPQECIFLLQEVRNGITNVLAVFPEHTECCRTATSYRTLKLWINRKENV